MRKRSGQVLLEYVIGTAMLLVGGALALEMLHEALQMSLEGSYEWLRHPVP